MPKFREWVLFHEPTGTLLTTDLVFNRPKGTGLSPIFFLLFGTASRFAVSRLFKTMIKDRAEFVASCSKIAQLPNRASDHGAWRGGRDGRQGPVGERPWARGALRSGPAVRATFFGQDFRGASAASLPGGTSSRGRAIQHVLLLDPIDAAGVAVEHRVLFVV